MARTLEIAARPSFTLTSAVISFFMAVLFSIVFRHLYPFGKFHDGQFLQLLRRHVHAVCRKIEIYGAIHDAECPRFDITSAGLGRLGMIKDKRSLLPLRITR